MNLCFSRCDPAVERPSSAVQDKLLANGRPVSNTCLNVSSKEQVPSHKDERGDWKCSKNILSSDTETTTTWSVKGFVHTKKTFWWLDFLDDGDSSAPQVYVVCLASCLVVYLLPPPACWLCKLIIICWNIKHAIQQTGSCCIVVFSAFVDFYWHQVAKINVALKLRSGPLTVTLTALLMTLLLF